MFDHRFHLGGDVRIEAAFGLALELHIPLKVNVDDRHQSFFSIITGNAGDSFRKKFAALNICLQGFGDSVPETIFMGAAINGLDRVGVRMNHRIGFGGPYKSRFHPELFIFFFGVEGFFNQYRLAVNYLADEILDALGVLEDMSFFIFLDDNFQTFIEEGLGLSSFKNPFYVELDFWKNLRVGFKADFGSLAAAGFAFFYFSFGLALRKFLGPLKSIAA